MTVELLRAQPESQRAMRNLSALASAALASGIKVRQTQAYAGHSDLLVLWGPGAPDRFDPMCRQVAAGGHVVALDLSYWQRDLKFRISFDAPHPQRWVMRRSWPRGRCLADGVRLVSAWDPRGPVIVAGIGEKAGVQYGVDLVRQWERDQIRIARDRGYRVRYRPKKNGGPVPDVPLARPGTIDQALQGASMVVTWHSNVAVDAIRLGIPVLCRDGAAAAICPSDWPDEIVPLDLDLRTQFLANLAWFQWAPAESSACWAFIREALCKS